MDRRVRSAVLMFGLFYTVFGSCPARAQGPNPAFGSPAPGMAYTMGEIGRRAAYGSDGDWQTTASPDGSLIIKSENAAPGWTADIVRSPPLPYTVDVQVRSGIAQVAGHAVGAGVVFGFQRASGSAGPKFFTAMITDGTLFVYEMDGTFQQILRSAQDHVSRDFDRMTVNVRADGFTISVNGNGSNAQSVDRPLTGEFGVIASGAGQATFRNLAIK